MVAPVDPDEVSAFFEAGAEQPLDPASLTVA